MKCNLDCSYCDTGPYGGHDNTTRHPPIDQCLKAIDFMFEYVDIYMSRRKNGLKYVFLNVYGGESLHHPDIVEILKTVHEKYKPYQNQWTLQVTTTTNAIVSTKKLQAILPFIDEFTLSYHVENTDKNKQLFRNNLLAIKAAGRRQKCVVLMHAEQEWFDDCKNMIAWLEQNQIKYLPRQLDHARAQTHFNYNSQQINWFNDLYSSRGHHIPIIPVSNKTDLADIGRACCGGKTFWANEKRRENLSFVNNTFVDWFCSVNQFFLYIKQSNGEIYTNKDCKMNFEGEVKPIGNLSNTELLLNQTKTWVQTSSMPVIQCKKQRCYCGLCAPKAADIDTYKKIMEKYEIPFTDLLHQT